MQDTVVYNSIKTDPTGDRLGTSGMMAENKKPVSQTGIAPRDGVSLYSHYEMDAPGRQVFADGLLDALGNGIGIFCVSKEGSADTVARAFYAHYPGAVSSAYGSITGNCPGQATLTIPFQEVNAAPGFPAGGNIRLVADPDNNLIYAGSFKGQQFSTLGTQDNSIWMTADGGTNWVQKNDGSAFDTNFKPSGFGLLGGALYAWGNISTTGGATYKSTDQGVTWNTTETHTSGIWGARGGAGTCVFGGKLWLAGGANLAGSNLTSDVWSTPDGVVWSQATASAGWGTTAPFSVGRNSPCLVALSTGIVLVSGNQGVHIGQDAWFSADGAVWVQQAPDHTYIGRNQTAVVAINDSIFMYGGYNSQFDGAHTGLDDMYQSTDLGVTWTRIIADGSVTGIQRNCVGMVALNGNLYLCGGLNCSVPGVPGGVLMDFWGVAFTDACIF